MKKIFLIMASLTISAFAMEKEADWKFKEVIEDKMLVSSGSIILVKQDINLRILLGERNKPGKDEHGTWGSFHGNIIRGKQIYDIDALEAAKRNLVWEMIQLEGDPKKFPLAENESVLGKRQKNARDFINKLQPRTLLKNSDWNNKQRPNFVFVVDYEDIKEFIDNFDDNKNNKEWRSEISTLRLFDAKALVQAISEQKAENNGTIPYGKFTQYCGKQFYDAFTRTIAFSLDEFNQVLADNTYIDHIVDKLTGPLSFICGLNTVCDKYGPAKTAELLIVALNIARCSLSDITNKYGTPMHDAAEMINPQILKLLIDNPHFSQETSKMLFTKNEVDGHTPLHLAVDEDLSENADIILASVADKAWELVLMKDNCEKSVLEMAFSNEMRKTLRKYCPLVTGEVKSDLINYCLQNCNNFLDMLPRVCCQCEPELAVEILLIVLLKNKTSVCSTNEKRHNGFHLSSNQFDIEMFNVVHTVACNDNQVWALLSAGDKRGRTPLHRAVRNGCQEVIEANLKAAEKIGKASELMSTKDEEGWTAIDYAMGDENTLKLFEKYRQI